MVGNTLTVATGWGITLIVTVEIASGQGKLLTVYVKTYGLPAEVKLDTFKVPKCPFEVATGPVQTPLVFGVPDN